MGKAPSRNRMECAAMRNRSMLPYRELDCKSASSGEMVRSDEPTADRKSALSVHHEYRGAV